MDVAVADEAAGRPWGCHNTRLPPMPPPRTRPQDAGGVRGRRRRGRGRGAAGGGGGHGNASTDLATGSTNGDAVDEAAGQPQRHHYLLCRGDKDTRPPPRTRPWGRRSYERGCRLVGVDAATSLAAGTWTRWCRRRQGSGTAAGGKRTSPVWIRPPGVRRNATTSCAVGTQTGPPAVDETRA